MPSVYTFTRSDSEILQELLRVFSSGRGTAREQWSMQAEMLVEPVGWDALWKLSKNFCKKFEVRYPCIAYVSVMSVDFDSLSASVDVMSVQHAAVSLPEVVDDVPLIELWPTEEQRETCVNAAVTAEFIDLLRFFYNNIWMPWDDQDDKVLLNNTIEERMQLWCDMNNGAIPGHLARSITVLRTSAIDAHDKLKELDSSLCAGDLVDEDDSLLPPNYISLCAEMSARLDGLMAKWTLYENPLIREQYLAKMKDKWQRNRDKRNVVALWEGGSVFEFEEIAAYLRARVSADQTLSIMVSAEEALALEPEELLVCSKSYDLPEIPLSNITLASFNDFCGPLKMEIRGLDINYECKIGRLLEKITEMPECATLSASETRSWLALLGGRCVVRDVTLQSARAGTLLVARAGAAARVANCVLQGHGAATMSDFAQGIVAMSGSKVIVEDCTFENFYSGIVIHKGAQVELRNSLIKKCGVGIQMYGGSLVTLTNTTIAECSEQSIRCEADLSSSKPSNTVDGLNIKSHCNIGSGDLQKEILIVQQDVNLL